MHKETVIVEKNKKNSKSQNMKFKTAYIYKIVLKFGTYVNKNGRAIKIYFSML